MTPLGLMTVDSLRGIPFVRIRILAGANRDEQMSKGWLFFLLNDEQMSNWLGVEHQPDKIHKPPRLHLKTNDPNLLLN